MYIVETTVDWHLASEMELLSIHAYQRTRETRRDRKRMYLKQKLVF